MFLYSLLGVNALVYAGWQYAQNEWDQRKDPRSLLWMTENFLCGEINMSQGRPWTLITACVSHSSFSHFAINMVSLAFMSPPIIRLVGRKAFLGLYFGAGLISSGISIGWKKYIDPTFGMLPRDSSGNAISTGIYSHGASGE
jgi:membrane associated rhomboid family serine protease